MSAEQYIEHDELMALWCEGRRIAAARCMGTLGCLRRGEGGFYEVEDLWQDLFLEFWRLVVRWRGAPSPRPLDDLWAEWRSMLWDGGSRVLRRRPQRLWAHADKSVDRDVFALGEGEGEDAVGLSPTACAALVEEEEPAEALAMRSTLGAVARRLWSLGIAQRQALYLTAIVGLSADEAARCLHMRNAAEVYRCAHAARRVARRQRVGSEKGGRSWP